jgi:chromosome segregation ATPase
MQDDPVDTSPEAVERLAARMQRDGENEWRAAGIKYDSAENRRVHCAATLRALAAERDALATEIKGWVDNFDRAASAAAGTSNDLEAALARAEAAERERDELKRENAAFWQTYSGLSKRRIFKDLIDGYRSESKLRDERDAAIARAEAAEAERDALLKVARAARDVHESAMYPGMSEWAPIHTALNALPAGLKAMVGEGR